MAFELLLCHGYSNPAIQSRWAQMKNNNLMFGCSGDIDARLARGCRRQNRSVLLHIVQCTTPVTVSRHRILFWCKSWEPARDAPDGHNTVEARCSLEKRKNGTIVRHICIDCQNNTKRISRLQIECQLVLSIWQVDYILWTVVRSNAPSPNLMSCKCHTPINNSSEVQNLWTISYLKGR